MKQGISNFIGKRLQQAREILGITVSQLAEYLNISRQVIYQYENNESKPTVDTFSQLCIFLKQSPEFFTKPILISSSETIHYRKLKKTKPKTLRLGDSLEELLREMICFVNQYVDLPTVDFPDLGEMPKDPTLITQLDIEEIANATRRYWKLNDEPAPHLVRLLESKGVVISRSYFGDDDLDGLSVWGDIENRPFIILNADKNSQARSRFDLCHELGHMILHKNISKEILLDKDIFNMVEDQAHSFASAFLMPYKSWSTDVYAISLDAFQMLKTKWRVSIGAMIKRAYDVNLISENEYNKMWINYVRRGWRFKEPYDNEWEAEKPALFSQIFDLLISNNILSKDQIANGIAIDRTMISHWANLPLMFFEPEELKINLLKS